MADIITKKPKSEQTKQNIIDTYLKLIPSKCWDKITVKELCAQANITRGTFYQYYSDIYDLMEQIENTLLDDVNRFYNAASKSQPSSSCSTGKFEDSFDYAPPQLMTAWFKFCKKNKKEIAVMLDPKHSDVYFMKKLKNILSEHINQMMDDDGLPGDTLRSYFTKLLIEMHFLAARYWLEEEDEADVLSTTDILNLLNTMRVGANYLHYFQSTRPDFDIKMNIPEDNE